MSQVANAPVTRSMTHSACVLLFTRGAHLESRAKGIAAARILFERIRGRLETSIDGLPGVDLVVAGADGGARGRSVGQRGQGFGDRLRAAFRDAADLGYRKIIAVPIDVPGLGAPEIRGALEALDSRPAVLGPSPDGGVYLIGVRSDSIDLLRNVAWKTPAVFNQLCRNAVEPAILGPLRDLDGHRDLEAATRDPDLDPETTLLIEGLLSRTHLPPTAHRPGIPVPPERTSAPPRAPPARSAAHA